MHPCIAGPGVGGERHADRPIVRRAGRRQPQHPASLCPTLLTLATPSVVSHPPGRSQRRGVFLFCSTSIRKHLFGMGRASQLEIAVAGPEATNWVSLWGLTREQEDQVRATPSITENGRHDLQLQVASQAPHYRPELGSDRHAEIEAECQPYLLRQTGKIRELASHAAMFTRSEAARYTCRGWVGSIR